MLCRGVILILTLFATSSYCIGQDEEMLRKDLIAIELGGPSPIASLNYERVWLERERFDCRIRAGIGAIKFKDFTRSFNPDLIFPIGIYSGYNLTPNKKSRLSAEAGLGTFITSVVHANRQFEPQRRQTVNGFASIGGRLDLKKGLMFRLSYTPLFNADVAWFDWFGLTIGYSFH